MTTGVRGARLRKRLFDILFLAPYEEKVPEGPLCPACGHERGLPQEQEWFVRVFRMRPMPAMCQGSNVEFDWRFRCDCTHPFHGS